MATPKKNKPFIVKVQIPLFASHAESMKEVLIYNEDRSIQQMFATPKWLPKAMKGQPKQFFYATSENGWLRIRGIAPWQSW